MKKVIASKDQFAAILRQDAEHHHGISTGVKPITLSTALHLENTACETAVFTLKKLLNEHSWEFPIYRDMFHYPAFLQEIFAFVKKVIAYDIPVDSLPKRNDNEEELARIISLCMQEDWVEKHNIANIGKYTEEIRSSNDYCLYPHFIKEPYLYEIWKELAGTVPVVKFEPASPQVHLKHALSSRQEMEAVAQDICRRGKPCNVVLTSMSNQYPLLASVFTRYGIPYRASNVPVTVHMHLIFASLLRYGVTKSSTALEEACSVNAFGVSMEYPVSQYLFSHIEDLLQGKSAVETIAKDPVLSSSASLFERMEQKSMQYLDAISEKRNRIEDAETPQEIILASYKVLSCHPLLSDPVEMSAAMNIRSTVQNVLSEITTEEDILFLADYIENTGATTEIAQSDFCTVTDLTHPVMPAEITYVISADGSSYPGVPSETGLFDEKYMEAVEAYPAQLSRNRNHISQLEWIEHSASEEVIFSWHTNDYQGREVQLALEIEQKFGKNAESWLVERTAPQPEKPHHLSEETASALFFRNGKIKGSVSTVEQYFHCPYAFFIRKGLRIREPDYGELNPATTGTLQHHILETSIQKYGKKYASITEEEIREIISPVFDDLRQAHPEKKSIIAMTQERMCDGIRLTLKFLESFENSTSFVPSETEMRFCEEIVEGVTLEGVIDRLDVYGKEFFRIIDYKSTSYELSESKVRQCLQLQLLSYAVIARKLLGSDPAGVYYCSLKADAYQVPAMKKSRKDLTEYEFDENSEYQRMMNNRQLKGWTFTDRTTELDSDGTHIATLSKTRSFGAVRQCMQEIYTLFRTRLLNGDISLSPDEDACKFCRFRPVCRFHGELRSPSKVIDDHISFTEGKE